MSNFPTRLQEDTTSPKNERGQVNTEKKSFFREVISSRNALVGLFLAGAVLIYKGYDWLSQKSESDIKPGTAVTSVIPKKEYRQRAIQITEVSQPHPRSRAESVTPEKSFAPNPSEDTDEAGLDEEKRTASQNFINLPHGELEESIEELGLDEIEEVSGLLDVITDLREAIQNKDIIKVQELANEFLRVSSILKTPEVIDKFDDIVRDYKKNHDGSSGPRDLLRTTLRASYHYAEQLAQF